MTKKQVLFLSWQGGMGHITRDVAIAKELHLENPDIELVWLAHPLAAKVLQQAGEKLLPESQSSVDYNQVAMPTLTNFTLNLMKYVQVTGEANEQNIDLFKQVIRKYPFDLVIGDESFEVSRAMLKDQVKLDCPMLMIEDFIGLEAMTNNPLEWVGIYQKNRFVALTNPRIAEPRMTRLFVGELEDVRDKPFGFLLPNRREFARKYYHFLGYIIGFDPADYADKAGIRAKLGYGKEPLLICATGGTVAGKELLETCGQAYPILKKKLPELRMVCVCGELYGLTPPKLPAGVELHGYIPNLYEHYAACDLAVVVGGGTTTVELTALHRPFIYFPLENQFDQQLYIAERLERQEAGIKMKYFQTSPEQLAQNILDHMGEEVKWKQIPIDGARKAARIINNLLVEPH
jgi:UDP-N-acetylglucosamine:LPS N-acetylglucosamine transferase